MNWDQYFHDICVIVSSKSPCLSRKIGAILVRDNSIIATGYNGPPRGTIHCSERISTDLGKGNVVAFKKCSICPRRELGYSSGKGLEHCPAVHAEMNAVIAAARSGASTLDSILYMNCVIPCKQCMGILINAGIKEIVVDSCKDYDSMSSILRTSPLYPSIRAFNL